MNWQRPTSKYPVGEGLLLGEQFQIAYATNDIEQSKKDFANRFGIRSFSTLEGATPAGGYIQVALAWVGKTMYELLTASGQGSELYMSNLSEKDYQVRLHHLGFILHSDEQWQRLHHRFEQANIPVLYENHANGFMRSCFIDAPGLGHFFEYLYPEPAGLDFFMNNVPKH